MKIYIDQGHNPVNPNSGAEGNGLREQDITYTVGKILAEELESAGIETRLSRPTPETQLGNSNATSLAARTNDANDWGADYFISIHTNASEFQNASGSEAFVYSPGSTAATLAGNILYALSVQTGLANRGVKARPSLYVLRKTKMPAVLVEIGFITNPYDASLMSNRPDLFAEGIANGVFSFLGNR